MPHKFTGLVLATAAATEPVTLTEAKLHLAEDGTANNTLITDLVAAAREAAETYTRRQFIEAIYEAYFDEFPDEILLPRPPLISVTSPIVYIDTNGTSQNFASTEYQVDITREVGRIKPGYGKSWPSTRDDYKAVKVTYKAGYGAIAASVPKPIKQALLLMIGDWYKNREPAEMPSTARDILRLYRVMEWE